MGEYFGGSEIGRGAGGSGDGEAGAGVAAGSMFPRAVPHMGQTLALLGSTRLKYSQPGLEHLFTGIGFEIFIWHRL
jgi:hypothetical protein